MKKVYKSKKHKKYFLKRAKSTLKERLVFRKYLKKKRKSEIGLTEGDRHYKRKYKDPYDDYIRISAPDNFSFIDNSIEVVRFIGKLKRHFDKKNKVFVVLSNVKKISYDAIVVLLSIMVKFKASKIAFNGDLPNDLGVLEVLKESQFFKYLYKQQLPQTERYNLGQNNSILTHAWKHVDSELGSQLIRQATKTVWGEERRCQGVQRTLIELMLNTNNHADDTKKGEKHWWLSVYHHEQESKVSFAFIDFGVGIFTSLNNKRSNSKFFGVLSKLKEKINYGNNSELLKLILDGTVHKTATGKPFHGKGLPGINMALQRNQISNLNIITNDVHGSVEDSKYRIMKESFSGTFIYWELKNTNLSCHGHNSC